MSGHAVPLQPEDIYSFGTQYFNELLALTEAELDGLRQSSPGIVKASAGKQQQEQQHARQPTPQPSEQQPQQQQQHQEWGEGAGPNGVDAMDISVLSPQEIEALIMREWNDSLCRQPLYTYSKAPAAAIQTLTRLHTNLVCTAVALTEHRDGMSA
jgi:hypothetical protein